MSCIEVVVGVLTIYFESNPSSNYDHKVSCVMKACAAGQDEAEHQGGGEEGGL